MQNRRRRTFVVKWLVACLLLSLAPAYARADAPEADVPEADVPEALAELVPDDVGLLIEVRHLPEQLDRFRAGALRRRLVEFPPLARFLEENGDVLAGLAAQVRAQTGLSTDQWVDRLLAGRWLIGVWAPIAPGEHGPALLIVDAPQPDDLAQVARHLLAAQRAAGREVRVESMRQGVRDVAIHRIELGADEPPLFLVIDGRLGIVATDRTLLDRVLRLRAGNAQRSLADSPSYEDAIARVDDAFLARVFVNVPAWTRLLSAQDDGDQFDAADRAAHRSLLRLARASQYAIVTLNLAPRFVVEGYVKFDAASESTPRVTPAIADDLAARLPADAVVALAGRVDMRRLIAEFFRERPASARGESSNRWDVAALAALLGERGSDTVAALVARDAAGTRAMDWVAGFDTRPWMPQNETLFAQGLDPLFRALLTAAVVMQNRPGERLKIESVGEGGVPLTSVVGLSLLGCGDSATFASYAGYFWAGSSRGAVRDVARLAPAESLADDAAFQALANPRIARRTHFAYVHLSRLRDLLWPNYEPSPSAERDTAGLDSSGTRTEGEAAAEPPATAHSTPRGGPAPGGLADLLALADRLLIEAQVDGAGVHLSATVVADSAR